MRRSRVFAVAAVAACLALSACTGTGAETHSTGSASASVVAESPIRIDSPALRTLKRAAGVEPCPVTTAGGPAPVAGGLPDITLGCLGGGRPVTLSALRGPLVVNLFASWCGPCRGELPYYQALHATGRNTVRVLGVDYSDAAPDSALALAKQAGVTYPLVADPARLLRRPLYARGLPMVVLVDRSGRVVDVEARAFRSYAELRALVEQKLHVDLPA